MTPTEVARGYLTGRTGVLPPPTERRATPRQVLERLLLDALVHGPCAVAFSGGRDSSLLLALATEVARREGLPPPIPVTRVFPDLPETDEHDWQASVISHIGLDDWVRVELHDELDVIGPLAQRHLMRHGVVWPAAIATSVPIFELVPGGTMVDGEGGDEILGHDAHRIAPVAALLRRPRPLRRRRVRQALGALAPAAVRRPRAHRDRAAQPLTWLRPAARAALVGELTADRVDRPLSFARSVVEMPQRRSQFHAAHNRAVLAGEYGVRLVSPLLDPDFVPAVAGAGGWLGPGDRTAVLRRITGNLLPERVLTRRSKAAFNRAYIGGPSRRFAEAWSGTGLDTDLVDPEALRAAWLAEPAHWMSATALQAAWLADHSQGQTDRAR